jgi:hypothetical protein
MKRLKYLMFPAFALVAMAVVFAFAPTGSNSNVADPTAVPHFRSSDVRVQITDDAVVSRNQDPVYVQLETGEIPADVTYLTVLTDEDCVPDADGVSHCLNRIEFETAGGTQTAGLRHHHKMAEEPCLTPGQTLELVR